MKKYLLLFASFFIKELSSQEYVPLLKEGNKWYQTNINYNFGGPSSITGYYHFINGEETKNGFTYKKLYFNTYCYSSLYPSPCFPVESSDVFFKLIRENVDEKKIYYYDEQSNSDVLMYDFSLNIGDEIPNNLYLTNNNYHDGNQVKSIVNGKVFNRNVKSFSIDDYGSYNIYEGIGSNTGLFYKPGGRMFEGGNWLTCFEDISSGKSCDSEFLNTKEVAKKKAFTLAYSKESDSFKIFGKNGECNVKFYDASGKLLNDLKLNIGEYFSLKSMTSQNKVLYYELTSSGITERGSLLLR